MSDGSRPARRAAASIRDLTDWRLAAIVASTGGRPTYLIYVLSISKLLAASFAFGPFGAIFV
jgi:hypothetical protein